MASIDGLSSGLDTTAIINQLMQLERMPQQRLQTKQTATENSILSLRTLNTKFLSILIGGREARRHPPRRDRRSTPPPTDWQLATATSSDTDARLGLRRRPARPPAPWPSTSSSSPPPPAT